METNKKIIGLDFPHQDENTWLYVEAGGVRQQQYPSPLEVKMLVDQAEAIGREKALQEVLDSEEMGELPASNEEPFVPHYKPYGMSEEEYAHEIHRHEQKRAEWQYQMGSNQAITAIRKKIESIIKT